MSDLVAFLNARLDEDEAVAKAATPGPWWHESSWGEFLQTADGSINGDGYARAEDVIHQARHDPARVLREVEAKRKIMGGHDRNESRLGDYCNCQVDDGMIYGKWPCPDLAAMATVWSEDPDYDPEWA